MQNQKIEITTEFIKLDSFLKLVGAVVTGGQAKMMIKDSKVQVNGECCLMRGKKLYDKDTVLCDGVLYEVCCR